ncbi:MAG: UPF0147 family protein [Candidatus Nitrosopelagicus sp.]|jgi:uncharacterized protein (UPF0147 family)|uniref:UPF0147 protein n=2 Tax=root TaxID=1 RepID=A0A075HBS9_9ARCH|nr:hypothetical protein conserved in archaea [uncultured marine thaumarchaeote KM3_61_H06]MCH2407127.1 UPF0147 family protein [Candidatus Nitrosopelagicus sp.]NWJ90561.1 UPF0147 family protein [Marine Group I thaumarchaeote]PXF27185.1 MAG: hypothetical protein CXX67_06530 [Nitrososphaerota archaeon]HIA09838.1 hypothetical protein [Candidatus Nitrosopelagicus sp.]|tara:strand:- start:573 stop:842 length:270 start_codon:yes stop_codon:yes gene_type:complete
MVSKEENIKFLDNAMSSLNQLATSPSTPRNIRKSITSLLEELKSEEYSMSVRAANTTSLLDDITQDPNMPSYVRTSLWQIVSMLENIRE